MTEFLKHCRNRHFNFIGICLCNNTYFFLLYAVTDLLKDKWNTKPIYRYDDKALFIIYISMMRFNSHHDVAIYTILWVKVHYEHTLFVKNYDWIRFNLHRNILFHCSIEALLSSYWTSVKKINSFHENYLSRNLFAVVVYVEFSFWYLKYKFNCSLKRI